MVDRPEFDVDRRSVLRAVGGSAIGLAALSGTASARPHAFQFFGCSQVCADSEGNFAVVWTDDGYECRPMDRASDRGNVPWDWESYCYEICEEEAIVGVLEENVWQGDTKVEDGTCTLCLNPNRCAENYYDAVSEIASDLAECDGCGACVGNITTEGGCTVYGSNGSPVDGEAKQKRKKEGHD